MLFAIGTKVRLKHTGDIGEVAAWLDHDLIEVRLFDGDVIPVLQSAIERIAQESQGSSTARFVPGKQKAEPLPLQTLPTQSQYVVLKPVGLQMAFDPVLNADGLPDYYRLFLVNDTTRNYLYQLTLSVGDHQVWNTQGKLTPRSMIEAGSLKYHELNHAATVAIQLWRLLPDGKGTGRRMERQVKLRPAQFFSKLTTAPYLNRQVYLYSIFTEKELLESPRLLLPPKNH
ncbi:MAG: hypothetical protein R2795_18300 [Saprospiraceae bacterium]